MNEPKDATGGSAFPLVAETSDGVNGIQVHVNCGMTLLDYFAAHAMQALVTASVQAERHLIQRDQAKWAASTASAAYALADAMLKERQS